MSLRSVQLRGRKRARAEEPNPDDEETAAPAAEEPEDGEEAGDSPPPKKEAAEEGEAAGDGEREEEEEEEPDASAAPAEAPAARKERARIAAILRSPEAKGREAAAMELALSGPMASKAAKRILASLPKGGPAASGLDSRMAASAGQTVGLGGRTQAKGDGWAGVIAKVNGPARR
jgi:capsid assembly protease